MAKIDIYSPIDNSFIGSVNKMSVEDIDNIYIKARKSYQQLKEQHIYITQLMNLKK